MWKYGTLCLANGIPRALGGSLLTYVITYVDLSDTILIKQDQTLNFMPPFAHITLPVHHPLSAEHNIPITPAIS